MHVVFGERRAQRGREQSSVSYFGERGFVLGDNWNHNTFT